MRRRECDLFRSDSSAFSRFLLLAQEVKPLLSRIHGYDHKQTQNHEKKEIYHGDRIARSPGSGLYRRFADGKQKCNRQLIGIEKKNALPRPSTLSAQILPPCASTMCFAMDKPKPVPLPVLDLSTR